jgi:hypothetical protein
MRLLDCEKGLRVRVYQAADGRPEIGTIGTRVEEGKVEVVFGNLADTEFYYPEQLRKLKPKQVPREFWIAKLPNKEAFVYEFKDELDKYIHASGTKFIHVREVLPKKEKS